MNHGSVTSITNRYDVDYVTTPGWIFWMTSWFQPE